MFYLCIRLITKHMDEITKIETVDQYDSCLDWRHCTL